MESASAKVSRKVRGYLRNFRQGGGLNFERSDLRLFIRDTGRPACFVVY